LNGVLYTGEIYGKQITSQFKKESFPISLCSIVLATGQLVGHR
jgi:hypothetical protein